MCVYVKDVHQLVVVEMEFQKYCVFPINKMKLWNSNVTLCISNHCMLLCKM